MDEAFKIYADQLRNGHIEQLDEKLAPDFMEIQDEDLTFLQPIEVTGEAYIADQELILHLNVYTQATIPCAICNEPVLVDVSLDGFYHAVPYEELKSGIYDYRHILREAILLETPRFGECEGKCPKRKEIQKYLKKEGAIDDQSPPEEGQQPFAHLK